MAIKYYTQFALQDEHGLACREFDGVIEVDLAVQTEAELRELEALLAQRLSVEIEDVTVLHCSRVH